MKPHSCGESRRLKAMLKKVETENWYYRQYLDGKYGRLPDILRVLDTLRKRKANKR